MWPTQAAHLLYRELHSRMQPTLDGFQWQIDRGEMGDPTPTRPQVAVARDWDHAVRLANHQVAWVRAQLRDEEPGARITTRGTWVMDSSKTVIAVKPINRGTYRQRGRWVRISKFRQ